MKTFILKKEDVVRSWYHYDATGVNIGILAEKIAIRLMGKDKPEYTPHVDSGDFILVTNISDIAISGKKETNKMYYKHSGYMGGLKKWNFKELKEKKPEYLLFEAVKGMLPRNKLASNRLKRLKIFRGTSHPHKAQKPQTVTL
ncbi:MAG: 50S ribosomal protein L13 [Candidatus Aureabacteria bacterium]|nr:50S ribosomal protein L13 [Candidatus Auribacterota bacterium]